MPLEVDKFEQAEDLPIDKDSAAGKNQESILAFLTDHPFAAFTQREIQEELEIEKPACVFVALHALLRKGKVVQKKVESHIYWIISREEIEDES